jgi:antitoxin CptB
MNWFPDRIECDASMMAIIGLQRVDTNASFSADDLKKLYWHSRRGMLELDLLLVPFAETCLAQLSTQQLLAYRALLAEEDQDLFMWLTRREPAPSVELRAAVEQVLERARQVVGRAV